MEENVLKKVLELNSMFLKKGFCFQSFQNFIRQSSHEACHRFDTGGVWRNLVVRSTQSGEKMATVIVHPQQLGEDGIQEIMEDLRKYYFEGEGSECELDSLYLQAWYVVVIQKEFCYIRDDLLERE